MRSHQHLLSFPQSKLRAVKRKEKCENCPFSHKKESLPWRNAAASPSSPGPASRSQASSFFKKWKQKGTNTKLEQNKTRLRKKEKTEMDTTHAHAHASNIIWKIPQFGAIFGNLAAAAATYFSFLLLRECGQGGGKTVPFLINVFSWGGGGGAWKMANFPLCSLFLSLFLRRRLGKKYGKLSVDGKEILLFLRWPNFYYRSPPQALPL